MYDHQDDDLLLPEASEPTSEAPRATGSGLEWPFSRLETCALVLLYMLPFIIRELVRP